MLEQRAVMLEGPREVCGLVLRAEPAPGNEISAWRDGGGRVDLQQCQPPHDREQVRWPGRVEQLRTHRDTAGLRLGEPVHGQEATSGCQGSDCLARVCSHVVPAAVEWMACR